MFTLDAAPAWLLAAVLAVLPWVASTSLRDAISAPKQAILLPAAALVVLLVPVSRAQLNASPRQVPLALIPVVVVIAFLLSPFHRETLLGWYGVRLGMLTWVSAGVLGVAAALLAANPTYARVIRLGGVSGLCIVALLALAQETGASTTLEQLRVNTRSTAMVGTANDLAAFALVAFGFLWRPGQNARLEFAGGAALSLAVLLSLSRAGAALAVLTLVAIGVLAALVSTPRTTFRQVRWLFLGACVGALIALPTGAPAALLGRYVEERPPDSTSNVRQRDLEASGGVRLELWEAGMRTALARPASGYGPDALPFVYGRHRQESETLDLYYNYQVESAHNILIDLIITGGFPLLTVVLAAIISGVWISFQSLRRREIAPIIALASFGGFGGMALLNPISIPTLVYGLVLLGLLTTGNRTYILNPRIAFSISVVGFVVLVASLVFSFALVRAESTAAEARIAYLRGDYARAMTLYHDASEIMPFERWYAVEEFAAAVGLAAKTNQPDALARADALGETVHRRFHPLIAEVLTRARIAYLRDPNDERVEELLNTARSLQPSSPTWQQAIAEVRR
ncbi:MAG: hypothetical protein KatS3mg063_2095 [Tepidiforma sp.]|uniref:O-antigen ligase family protein n=1 Tax=Tepidiforma sp. TaxID=2682230 RepID=UPI0021DC5D65|nr:O-antigen ligase family protein [Tepidiforma sp.]GIW16242.1 MAG: hypothetical protein KatS3mg063_2095 [Tepidiforma sp.]